MQGNNGRVKCCPVIRIPVAVSMQCLSPRPEVGGSALDNSLATRPNQMITSIIIHYMKYTKCAIEMRADSA
jgi:hypothetical protein